MDDGEFEPAAANNVGLALAGVWLLLGVLGCAGAGAAMTVSESLGVLASYVGFPLLAGGLAAMLVAPFLRRSGAAAAIGAPLGCGCFSSLAVLFAVVTFFAVIFPML